jgi:hypothetical protein
VVAAGTKCGRNNTNLQTNMLIKALFIDCLQHITVVSVFVLNIVTGEQSHVKFGFVTNTRYVCKDSVSFEMCEVGDNINLWDFFC